MIQSFSEYMEDSGYSFYSLDDAKAVAELLFIYELQRLETEESYAIKTIADTKIALNLIADIEEKKQ